MLLTQRTHLWCKMYPTVLCLLTFVTYQPNSFGLVSRSQTQPRGQVKRSPPSAMLSLPVRTSRCGSSLPLPWRSPVTAASMGTQSGSAVCGIHWPQRWRTVKTRMTSWSTATVPACATRSHTLSYICSVSASHRTCWLLGHLWLEKRGGASKCI